MQIKHRSLHVGGRDASTIVSHPQTFGVHMFFFFFSLDCLIGWWLPPVKHKQEKIHRKMWKSKGRVTRGSRRGRGKRGISVKSKGLER